MDMPKRKKPKPPKKPTAPKSLTGSILTKKLNELALDVISSEMDDKGEVNLVTRAEFLAIEIWDAACGIQRTEDGGEVHTHKPIPWAVGVVYERLEGKVIPRAKDRSNRPSLGKRISEQNAIKANAISKE